VLVHQYLCAPLVLDENSMQGVVSYLSTSVFLLAYKVSTKEIAMQMALSRKERGRRLRHKGLKISRVSRASGGRVRGS